MPHLVPRPRPSIEDSALVADRLRRVLHVGPPTRPAQGWVPPEDSPGDFLTDSASSLPVTAPSQEREAIPAARIGLATGDERAGPDRRTGPSRWGLARWFGETRLDPGRRGAAALVVIALLAVAFVGVLTWRSRPQETVVEPPSLAAGSAASGRPSAPPASGSPAEIVVAVAGKVRRPGVVQLPDGARVLDALRAAGGPLPTARLGLLNLARRLADGELVVVGVPGAVGEPGQSGTVAGSGSNGAASAAGGAADPSPAGLVDLNTATVEQLDTLPGVGPVLAQRIVDWRAEHGRFQSVDQLREVDGIGDGRFGELRDRVTV